MPNAWVEHVRQYAKDNNLTYACAIPYAKATYTKKDGTKSTPSKSLPAPKPEPKAKAKAKTKPEPKAKPKAKPSPPKPEPKLQEALKPTISLTERELAFAEEEWERIKKVGHHPGKMPMSFAEEVTRNIRKQRQADKERGTGTIYKPSPPKPEPKATPKPEPKAKATSKPVEQPKPKGEDINLKRFYDVLGKGFDSKRKLEDFKKVFGKDLLTEAVSAQLNGLDFYSTPPECILKHKLLTNIIKEADNILEPTAGLGALIYSALEAGAKRSSIQANDVIPAFVSFIQNTLQVKTTNDDFLSTSYKNNNYDLIMLNPPFSAGSNKLFYFDFLYKAASVLRDSKNRSHEKYIIFISPELNKPSARPHDVIGEDDFRLSNSRIKELREKNGYSFKLKDGQYDDDPFIQIQHIGVCEGFGGTKVTAHVYLVIV